MQRPSGHRFLRLESALAAPNGLAGSGENGEESSITDSCDGGDTEAGDADRVDRRELLAALGATAGTSVLAGCPGNNGGTSGETREFEAKPAAFTNGAVEQLGLPVKETTTHETSQAVSVGGEEYRVNSTQKITTYLGDESIRYRLGILSSPLARIDSEITSPVVNRDLSEFLTSKEGQRLLEALNVPSDWMNSPTRLEREPLGPEKSMLSNVGTRGGDIETTPVEVYEWSHRDGETVSGWYVALIRAFVSNGENAVVVACAGGDLSSSVPVPDRVRDLLFVGAPSATLDENFQWDDPGVPQFDLTDLRMVQTVENSRRNLGDGNWLEIPDPPIVAGEPAAALFSLDGDPNEDSPLYLQARIRADVEGTPATSEEIDIIESDLDGILGDPAASTFDELERDDGAHTTWKFGAEKTGYDRRLPVFSLDDGNDATVTVDVRTPVGHPVDSQQLSLGSDFELASVPPLRVAFIEVQHAGADKNTDIDWGDANGRAKNYERSVRSSFEYLRRVYPGTVIGYRLDIPMLAHDRTEYDKPDRARNKDARKARKILNYYESWPGFLTQGTILNEDVSRDTAVGLLRGMFDGRVMILPKGTASGNQHYYAARGDSNTGGLHISQKHAVGSLEAGDDSDDHWHGTTTAQELGHRFLTNFYEGDLARWDTNDEKDDLMHIHRGVSSVCYDVTDGKFTLVTNPEIHGGTFSTTKLSGDTPKTYDSYMSYGDLPRWADSETHRGLIDGQFDPTYSPSATASAGTGAPSNQSDEESSYRDSVQPVIEAFGTVEDGTVTFETSAVYDTAPEDHNGGTYDADHHPDAMPVEVVLLDPDDTVLREATVPDRTEHTHGDGVNESVSVSLPFPDTAVSLVARRDGEDTALNPIVAPLRDLVEQVPARGTVAGTETLSPLQEILDDVETLMAEGNFGDSAAMLDGSFREAVRTEVRAEYDRFAGEPRVEELTLVTERMIERLEVLDDEQSQGQQLECGTQLPSSITEDTVLQRDCQYTTPDEGVDITQDATLDIEPGVEIEVGGGVAINVTADGALTAQGTEDNPIEIHGSSEQRGHWQGIEIHSDDTDNELSHVDIAHAGGVYWNSAVIMPRNDPAQATIQHCTIRESSSAGIRVANAGQLVNFRDNTIENVSGPPLRLHPNRLGDLTGTTTFRNNDTGHILTGSEDNNVTEDATWPAMGLPYQFSTTVSIQAEVDIDAGTTLQFQQGGPHRLFVGGDGQLVADATDGDPITVRGVQEEPGSWGGIFVRTETDNLFDNVVVRHGGEGYREANIGVGIDDPGSLTIRNSVIGDGLKSGVLATNDAELVEFQNNTVENMEGPPLDLHPNRVGDLSGTSTFQNNAESYVLVGSEDNNVTADATWPAMDVPYQFHTTVSIQSAVDIEAGATLEFRQGGPIRLFVGGDGQLVADASGGDPITFRGVQETPGSWAGLFVRTTADNLLDNVVVSDGGEGYRGANIGVGIDGEGALTVRNSEISDSAGWGIILDTGTLTEENNTFSNNASGDIQRPDS